MARIDPIEEPDAEREDAAELAIGAWTCPCGLIAVEEPRGNVAVKVWCGDCDIGAEVLPLAREER